LNGRQTIPRSFKSRLNSLLAYDRKLLQQESLRASRTFAGIIGVDEVGRGSLIGPVVAAALVFHEKLDALSRKQLRELDDSKATHLNHEKRLQLAQAMKQRCYWGIGEADLHEVETLNVVQATFLAALRAVEQLYTQFPECCADDHVLVMDGKLPLPQSRMHQVAVVKADRLSASVAGASVIAKAHRDTYIIDLARNYPQYGWETNIGYNTPGHRRAMQAHGITVFHRKTYKAVQDVMTDQQSLEFQYSQ
jgi:ribonuclease HII